MKMSFKNIRNILKVSKVNSAEKQKSDDRYFNAFITDSINQLRKKESVICFYKEQLDAISAVVEVDVYYDSKNEWWVLSLHGK